MRIAKRVENEDAGDDEKKRDADRVEHRRRTLRAQRVAPDEPEHHRDRGDRHSGRRHLFFARDRIVFVGLVAEDRFVFSEDERASNQIRLFHHQIDRFFLRQLRDVEIALFECGAALVDEVFEMRFIDQLLEQLARRRLFGEIVFHQFDVLTFQVSNRIAAARSTRLEIDVDALCHFFLTHQAFAFAFF